MKIFAYMRFSSENQTNNTSIQTQREAIKRYVAGIAELRDLTFTEMIDEAKSATTLKGRIALQTMRQQAVRGDAVVVYKLDRLGRNLQDSLQVISDFENKGVRLYSTCEPEVPLVRHILLAVAEDFSRALGDRCRGALRSLASAGFATNKSPYGYQIEREPGGRGGKFVRIPDQAAVVQRIFQMRGEGRSHREIARALNEEAVPSPRGIGWNIATISHILKNEAYLGTIICGDRIFKKGHGLQGRREREKWSICEKAHEPIITEEQWAAVRRRAAPKRENATVRTRAQHVMTGFLKCAVCGGNLTRHNSRNIYYYGCETGRKYGMKRECQCRSLVRVDEATDAIVETLINLLPHCFEKAFAELRQELARVRESVGSVIGPLQDTIKRLTQQIEAAERRLVHIPESSLPVVLDEIKRMKAEKDEVQERLNGIKKVAGEPASIDELEADARKEVEQLPGLLRSPDVVQVRNALAGYVQKVEVWPDKKARLYLQPGFMSQLGVGRVSIPREFGTIPAPRERRISFNFLTYKLAGS